MKRLVHQERLNTKRTNKINGHPTSVSLEDAFWNALKEIAATREVAVSDLIATINTERQLCQSFVCAASVRARALSRSS